MDKMDHLEIYKVLNARVQGEIDEMYSVYRLHS